MTTPLCPCHQFGTLPLSYDKCCKPLHDKSNTAKTPEQLMRSRYSAFVKQQFEYLVNTHHPDFRQAMTPESLAQGSYPNWLGLSIERSAEKNDCGAVVFKAWYKDQQAIDAIYEHSEFRRVDGLWYYTQGKQFEAKLPKRNEGCVCQSGKKFKQCCM